MDECKPLALGLGLALPSAAPVRKTMWSNACSATSTLKAGAKSVGSVIEKAIPESERKLAQHAAQVSTQPIRCTPNIPSTCVNRLNSKRRATSCQLGPLASLLCTALPPSFP